MAKTPVEIELDGFIETRDVERLTSYSRRWIKELIKAGRFPPPDRPGGRGAPDLWRRSTVKRGLDQLAGCSSQPAT